MTVETGRLAAVERRLTDLETFRQVLAEREVHRDRRFDKIEAQNRELEQEMKEGLAKINASLSRVVFLVLAAIIGALANMILGGGFGG